MQLLLLLPKKTDSRATNKAMMMMMPIPMEPSSTCRCCNKKVIAHGYCPTTATTTRVTAAAAAPFPRVVGEASLSEDNNDNDSIQQQQQQQADVDDLLLAQETTGRQAIIQQQQQQQPVPCLDEPNLYQLPTDLHPTYRPLPLLIRMAVWMLSSLVVVVVGGSVSVNSSLSLSWTRILSSMMTMISTSRVGSAAALLLASNGESINNTNNNVARVFFRFVMTNRRYIIGSIFKILMLGFGINMILQERFRPPSRISTRSLMEKYFLPSKLSRFENVTLQLVEGSSGRSQQQQQQQIEPLLSSNQDRIINMGVHWLEYQNPLGRHQVLENNQEEQNNTSTTITTTTTTTRRILHLNHGFGASSLSWLPALPVMVEQLNCHFGLAHDAPGFGFTNRRRRRHQNNDDEYYSNKRSAKIGMALLKASLATNNSTVQHSTNKNVVVLLMGHSMGSLTTLRMALDLVKENKQNDNSFNITKCHVILVAPVFRSFKTTPKRRPGTTKTVATSTTGTARAAATSATSRGGGGGGHRRTWLSILRQRVGRLAVDRPAAFALRRLVSSQSSSSSKNNNNNGFWRRGLGQVWGDATRLSDADVLRFQWPSIGQGWEDGLIQFSKAQFASSSSSSNQHDDDDDDAHSILQQVLSAVHPQVTVDVIVGEKDPLVPVKSIDKYFADFMTNSSDTNNGVRLRVLPGLGHDPFEEDVEAFVETVKDLLMSSSLSS